MIDYYLFLFNIIAHFITLFSAWMPVPFMRVNPILNWYLIYSIYIICSIHESLNWFTFIAIYTFLYHIHFIPCRNYGQVWTFLRYFNLPYCSLYDKGYTSLGKTTDTFPNPALKRKNNAETTTPSKVNGDTTTDDIHIRLSDENSYWPAYHLADWSLERAGR